MKMIRIIEYTGPEMWIRGLLRNRLGKLKAGEGKRVREISCTLIYDDGNLDNSAIEGAFVECGEKDDEYQKP